MRDVFALDTSFVSLLTSTHEPLPLKQIAWLEIHVESCYAPPVVVHELIRGTKRLELRKSLDDRIRGTKLARANALLLSTLPEQNVVVDNAVFAHSGILRAIAEPLCGDIGFEDSFIAAIADLEGHVVVTCNVRQFLATGVRVLDARLLDPDKETAIVDPKILAFSKRSRK
jgi:predicted nucleic acid-binding protein